MSCVFLDEQIVLHVEPEDYVDHVTEAAMFKLSIMGRMKGSNQQFACIRNFRLLLPDLIVKVIYKTRTFLYINIVCSQFAIHGKS